MIPDFMVDACHPVMQVTPCYGNGCSEHLLCNNLFFWQRVRVIVKFSSKNH